MQEHADKENDGNENPTDPTALEFSDAEGPEELAERIYRRHNGDPGSPDPEVEKLIERMLNH